MCASLLFLCTFFFNIIFLCFLSILKNKYNLFNLRKRPNSFEAGSVFTEEKSNFFCFGNVKGEGKTVTTPTVCGCALLVISSLSREKFSSTLSSAAWETHHPCHVSGWFSPFNSSFHNTSPHRFTNPGHLHSRLALEPPANLNKLINCKLPHAILFIEFSICPLNFLLCFFKFRIRRIFETR